MYKYPGKNATTTEGIMMFKIPDKIGSLAAADIATFSTLYSKPGHPIIVFTIKSRPPVGTPSTRTPDYTPKVIRQSGQILKIIRPVSIRTKLVQIGGIPVIFSGHLKG